MSLPRVERKIDSRDKSAPKDNEDSFVKAGSDLDIDQVEFEKFKKSVLQLFAREIEKILIIQKAIARSEQRTIKMSKERNDIKFQVFDGKNYKIWKKRILLFLKCKKCEEPAIREMTANDTPATWDEQNQRAINYIYCGITDEQLEFIGDKESAFEIMKKFDQLYSKESSALQIVIRNKLDRLRLKDYDDSQTFFSDFEKLINDLKSAGGKVDEREKLAYILKALPDSMAYVGDLVDALKESDQTCEYVKNKISMRKVRSQGESNEKKSSAFKTEKKDMKCFGCGKPGHIKKNCRSTWQTGQSGAGGAAQGPGSARGQPPPPQQYSGQQYGGRGQYRGYQRGFGGRGRGRGWYQRNDGTAHDARYTYNDGEYNDGESFLTQIQRNEDANRLVVNNCESNKISWILDSGCSDHIINDDTYFSEFVNLKSPINVKVGDGRTLKGTKVGKVFTYFLVNGIK